MARLSNLRNSSTRWFDALPEKVRDEIEASSTVVKASEGQVVVRQGDDVRGLYGVVTGELQAIGTTTTGQDALIAIHRPSDWFGFLACADRGEYVVSVVATTDCDLRFLAMPAIERIFFQDPRMMRLFYAPQIAVNRATMHYLTEHLSYSPIQRLANRLLDLALSPYNEYIPIRTLHAVTQEQLAFSTLHSRQWTNRMLKQMSDMGLINVSRRTIEILDIEGLEKIADVGLPEG